MLQTILLLSGKGGVGKTLIGLHLGAALSRAGQRVLLAEMSAGFRQLDELCGADDLIYDLSDLLACRCFPEQALLSHPSGLQILPAAADPDFLPAPAALQKMIGWAQTEYDWLIFDTPSGFSRIHRTLAPLSSLALMVAEPTGPSVRAAETARLCLSRCAPLPGRLIINRVPQALSAGPIRDLDDVIDRVGLQLIGVLPKVSAFPPPQAKKGSSLIEEALDRTARRILGETHELLLY